jgi:hypothetical protein
MSRNNSPGRQRRKETRAAARAAINTTKHAALPMPSEKPETPSVVVPAVQIPNENQNINGPKTHATPTQPIQEFRGKHIFASIFGVGSLFALFSVGAGGFFGFFADKPAILMYPFAVSACLFFLVCVHTVFSPFTWKWYAFVPCWLFCSIGFLLTVKAVHIKESENKNAVAEHKQERNILTNMPHQFNELKEGISNLPKAMSEWQRAEQPTNIEWKPPELPKDCQNTRFSVRGVGAGFSVSELNHGSVPIFAFNDGVVIKGEIKNNRIYLDTTIPLQVLRVGPVSTQPINEQRKIEIVGNRVIGDKPPSWDMNVSDNAIEIVDAFCRPVLQIFYRLPNEIVIAGLPTMDPLLPAGSLDPKTGTLKRIFKYPAFAFPGKYDDN